MVFRYFGQVNPHIIKLRVVTCQRQFKFHGGPSGDTKLVSKQSLNIGMSAFRRAFMHAKTYCPCLRKFNSGTKIEKACNTLVRRERISPSGAKKDWTYSLNSIHTLPVSAAHVQSSKNNRFCRYYIIFGQECFSL